MILVKIQSKTFSGEALHVVASVENAIGTLIGSYSLDLPEDASDDTITKAILVAFSE
ncbi:MAG: hypothetical protein ACO25M_00075 [Limnohabitans sp.]|jgi:hypothetical protein